MTLKLRTHERNFSLPLEGFPAATPIILSGLFNYGLLKSPFIGFRLLSLGTLGLPFGFGSARLGSYDCIASIAGSVFMFHDALECIPIKYCLLLWRQLDMRFLVRGCTKELEVLCRLHWSKAEFIIFDSGLTN
ncbi:hypothetical protein Tco_1242701 [Tanacetum coccineum]